MRLVLKVNGLEVRPCGCNIELQNRKEHWTLAGIQDALRRPLYNADLISFAVEFTVEDGNSATQEEASETDVQHGPVSTELLNPQPGNEREFRPVETMVERALGTRVVDMVDMAEPDKERVADVVSGTRHPLDNQGRDAGRSGEAEGS